MWPRGHISDRTCTELAIHRLRWYQSFLFKEGAMLFIKQWGTRKTLARKYLDSHVRLQHRMCVCVLEMEGREGMGVIRTKL